MDSAIASLKLSLLITHDRKLFVETLTPSFNEKVKNADNLKEIVENSV